MKTLNSIQVNLTPEPIDLLIAQTDAASAKNSLDAMTSEFHTVLIELKALQTESNETKNRLDAMQNELDAKNAELVRMEELKKKVESLELDKLASMQNELEAKKAELVKMESIKKLIESVETNKELQRQKDEALELERVLRKKKAWEASSEGRELLASNGGKPIKEVFPMFCFPWGQI